MTSDFLYGTNEWIMLFALVALMLAACIRPRVAEWESDLFNGVTAD